MRRQLWNWRILATMKDRYLSLGGMVVLFSCLLACSPLPRDRYTIPLSHFGVKDEAGASENPQFALSPRDVLDVMYHFETVQSGKYQIAPHDKLSIKFLSAPAYDDIYQVRPDGYIALPLAGDINVRGMTVEEVQRLLVDTYRHILNRPEFFVNLAEFQVHLKEIQKSLSHPNLGQARLVAVRDDHKITLPLIGDLSVRDKTLEQLTREANSLYQEAVPGMSVDILLQTSQPHELYVFGEVNKPGGHAIASPVSIFAAMALAGGPNYNASLDTVLVLKKKDREMVGKVYDFNSLLTGKSDAVILHPDDIVYVPRSRLSTASQTMQYISNILLFRGMDVSYSYRLDNN